MNAIVLIHCGSPRFCPGQHRSLTVGELDGESVGKSVGLGVFIMIGPAGLGVDGKKIVYGIITSSSE
jgi:hypothetical protein